MSHKTITYLFLTFICSLSFAGPHDAQLDINKGITKTNTLGKNGFIAQIYGVYVADFAGIGSQTRKVRLYFELDGVEYNPSSSQETISGADANISALGASGSRFDVLRLHSFNTFKITDGRDRARFQNSYRSVNLSYNFSPMMVLPQNREDGELLPENNPIETLKKMLKKNVYIVLKAENTVVGRFNLNDLKPGTETTGNAFLEQYSTARMTNSFVNSGIALVLESKINGYESQIHLRLKPAIIVDNKKLYKMRQSIFKQNLFL